LDKKERIEMDTKKPSLMKAKKTKSLPKLKKQVLDLFAQYVKLKAASEGKLFCYTCDAPLKLNTSNCQLGHYLSRGAYPGLTFEPNNSRPQCYRCNIHLHGNLIEFRERLINEIGMGAVMQLEGFRHMQVKLSRSDYTEMINKYTLLIKELT
jgi:hypothetical protein